MSYHKMIYVLELDKGKWYVGYTDRVDGERFNEHLSGKGSKWSKLYPMKQLVLWRDGTLEDENNLTLEYMQKYGWWNVRGGNWCKVKMDQPPVELGHVTLPELCSKCGRNSHTADNCYAKTKLNGKKLRKRRVPKVKLCGKCGRNNHTTAKCYATSYY